MFFAIGTFITRTNVSSTRYEHSAASFWDAPAICVWCRSGIYSLDGDRSRDSYLWTRWVRKNWYVISPIKRIARSQKNRDGLAWFARRASQWLLLRVKERKVVKGQANEETCKPSGNWKTKGVSVCHFVYIVNVENESFPRFDVKRILFWNGRTTIWSSTVVNISTPVNGSVHLSAVPT